LVFVLSTVFSTLGFGVQPDRIAAPLTSGQVVPLRGNVHGMARAQFDQGRVDAATLMSGVSLVFKPSAAQQSELNKLLAEQQDASSPKYHKWLTPAQFADRFGMSRNDIGKVTDWLQSQGLTVTQVANSRNQVFFEGTVAQVESAFHTEIHNYLVDGELHYANASEPAVPAALGGMTLGLHNLHNFQPKARVNVRKMMFNEIHSHLTSHVSGNHFLTPGDFATIYDLQALGMDGAGQTIAVVGQSAVSLTDIHNFRNAAGLAANDPTLLLMPGSGTSTHCAGDEGESDLDLEWTGGVAKNAGITFVYVGLGTGTTCANRTLGAFDALQYSIDQNVAAFISDSYGLCENTNSAIGIIQADALTMQGWAQQANAQGQTIVAATGDTGAADCDFGATVAVDGLAVDIPASIPEVTGAGGTTFNGDGPGTVTGNDSGPTIYWSGTTGGTDAISSALSYIPEVAWNDTVPKSPLSASGGGTSIYFAKPTWQTGTGVPPDGKRDVPDIAVSASPNHDGYLICSPADKSGNPGCTNGFRDIQGNFDVVGGTSVSAPTFAATLALINQYLGNIPPGGLGNVNPKLYQLAVSTPSAFNDITSGNNIVPCTAGTTGCPASGQYGFSTNAGYDQVTGLGSINAFVLAKAWAATLLPTTTVLLPPSLSQSYLTQSVTFTANVTPTAANPAYVNFYNGTTLLGNATVNSIGVATFSTTSLPVGTASVTATYTGNGTYLNSTSPTAATVVVTPAFTLSPGVTTISVAQGAAGSATITMAPASGFNTPLTYTCTDPAPESICTMSPATGTNQTQVTVNVTTTRATGQLRLPLGRDSRIFYAALLPGLLGIVFTACSRKGGTRGMRLLGLIVVLGFSTLWLGACGNNSTVKNPGTTRGSYTLTINATSGGTTPVTGSTTVVLQVN
jgi:subtilase family serine protease